MNEWIPTSERMPELHQEVLLTVHNYVTLYNYVSFGYLCFDGKAYHVGNRSNEYVKAGSVIAWMELPAPYNADK